MIQPRMCLNFLSNNNNKCWATTTTGTTTTATTTTWNNNNKSRGATTTRTTTRTTTNNNNTNFEASAFTTVELWFYDFPAVAIVRTTTTTTIFTTPILLQQHSWQQKIRERTLNRKFKLFSLSWHCFALTAPCVFPPLTTLFAQQFKLAGVLPLAPSINESQLVPETVKQVTCVNLRVAGGGGL